ncbi:MAG TPA: LPS assembly lipoprotein LptE [Flavisolibacter sp.]|nr:LPS assembly lipoprotein LptE [Flavisolibacter sp.]
MTTLLSGCRKNGTLFSIGLFLAFLFLNFTFSSCGIYSFSEKGTIPDSVKTVRITTFENRAPYQNPQLTPNLTDRLRQKITNQTKLTITNSENVHWEIAGRVDDYSVTTTGVTSTNGQQQSSINRLSVRIHVTVNKRIDNKVEEFDVSRSFDFSARQSLQQAEATLLDEMIRNLTDEIFNKLFSDW